MELSSIYNLFPPPVPAAPGMTVPPPPPPPTSSSSSGLQGTSLFAQQNRSVVVMEKLPWAEQEKLLSSEDHQIPGMADVYKRQETFTEEALGNEETFRAALLKNVRYGEEWKIKHLNGKEMAEAGLYYTYETDRVTCFSCGFSFCNWECHDVPLYEHWKWVGSKCAYMQALYNHVPGVREVIEAVRISRSDPPSFPLRGGGIGFGHYKNGCTHCDMR